METVQEWMNASKKMLKKRGQFASFRDSNGIKKGYYELSDADKKLPVGDFIEMYLFGPVVPVEGVFENKKH